MKKTKLNLQYMNHRRIREAKTAVRATLANMRLTKVWQSNEIVTEMITVSNGLGIDRIIVVLNDGGKIPTFALLRTNEWDFFKVKTA